MEGAFWERRKFLRGFDGGLGDGGGGEFEGLGAEVVVLRVLGRRRSAGYWEEEGGRSELWREKEKREVERW